MANVAVVVACDDEGNVDTVDLYKIDEHAAEASCPHGHSTDPRRVRRGMIIEICAAVHDAGGQVCTSTVPTSMPFVGPARPG
ncbi:MAG: hypothetical protein IPH81_12655 [Candidatus Microthrix sp.]|nr:hypothetical protein [Candidatus Microthrix sp.]